MARHDHDAGGDPELLAAKAVLREQVWADLDQPGIARFPRPLNRIPNFVGAEAAARLLAETDEWRALANDPAVRTASFSSGAISWETHVAWFSAKLENPDSLILLAAKDDGEPVGQIRFDFRADDAEIGISIVPSARGRGWGPALIGAGVNYVRARRPSVKTFHAFVKAENRASLNAFIKAGFARAANLLRDGIAAVHFTLS